MNITINCEEAVDLLIKCIQARKVPMLQGQPGIGKSSIVKDIAKRFDLKLIDLRLSQCDPSDLLGFPRIDSKTNTSSYAPMDTFPLTNTPKVTKGGWLLFLDEFNSAPMSVQAAAYKLVLDRMVGLHSLHEDVHIICAGNLESDKAIVNRLSTAMQSRLVHLELRQDHKVWMKWANTVGIDHRVCSYLNYKPDLLDGFDPDHNDKTFPCGRTWEFVSDFVKHIPTTDNTVLPLIAGSVGEGAAREFIGFCKVYMDLPDINEIVKSPTTLDVPDEPSILYALSGALGNNAKEDNIEPIMKYVDRLPIEFIVITLRSILSRKPELDKHKVIREATLRYADRLM